MENLPADADAVVIGTGAFGISAAYHLAKLGMRNVVAVDQFAPASQASPRAAGLFKLIQADETRTRLARLSVDKMLHFEDETGIPLPVEQSGSLMVAASPGYAEVVREEFEHSSGWGVELELLGPEEAHRAMPFLECDGIRAACHTPGDVYIEEPKSLLDAYLEAASRLGVAVVPHTPVTGIRCKGSAVAAVVTSRGEIRTLLVVDAAGAWARMVGELSGGAAVPVQPVRHQLFITEPVAGMQPQYPILRLIDTAVYVRPSRGGLMLGGFEADPLPLDVRAQHSDFSTDDVPLDLTVLRDLAATVDDKVPALHDAELSEHRGGLFTMTPDGRFIAGPDPKIHGFWTLTGCNGSGFSFAPALGQVLAEWIVGGEPSLDISSLSPARYGTLPSDKEILQMGVWQYTHYYELPES
jgi:glycine/D-amino acid oxidase-like deaminating enzyme